MLVTMSQWDVNKADFIETPASFEEIAKAVGGPSQARMLINDAMTAPTKTATIHNASQSNAWPIKIHAKM